MELWKMRAKVRSPIVQKKTQRRKDKDTKLPKVTQSDI